MIQIRPAHAADVDTIVDFNQRLAAETEDRTLDRGRLRAGVAAVLADASKGRYFVADQDGRAVGQLLLTYEWSDWRNGMFWWIQSVYVAREARGRGVFAQLFRHVQALAREDGGVCGLRLYVEEDNTAAQAVYAKVGLAATGYRVMERELN